MKLSQQVLDEFRQGLKGRLKTASLQIRVLKIGKKAVLLRFSVIGEDEHEVIFFKRKTRAGESLRLVDLTQFVTIHVGVD